jgi:hypothetical protein
VTVLSEVVFMRFSQLRAVQGYMVESAFIRS